MIGRHEHRATLKEGHPPVPVQGQAEDDQPFLRNFYSDFPKNLDRIPSIISRLSIHTSSE